MYLILFSKTTVGICMFPLKILFIIFYSYTTITVYDKTKKSLRTKTYTNLMNCFFYNFQNKYKYVS